MRYLIASFAALSFLTAATAQAQQTEPAPPPPLVAPPPPLPPPPPPPPEGPPAVKSKWNATIYGFIEPDIIYDTTQSFNDAMGNGVIAKPGPGAGTYAGDHDRTTFSYRNSRIGFRFATPEMGGVKASGMIEYDFLGNQPPGITEPAFWSNPTMRARHVWLKLESDYVDVLFGQTWGLFGWQTNFHPNTVQIQGVPGEVFSRMAQLRISHMFKTDPVNVEVAIAAARPPQRDSGVPDGQGGLRLVLNNWKGVHVAGGGGAQSVDGLSIGVSGLVRSFRVVNFTNALESNKKTAGAVSFDGFIPIIPVTGDSKGNGLTLTASLQTGSGYNDMYSGFTGGVTFPAVPNPGMTTPAPTYTPNIDPGLVTYDPQGNLHPIKWTSYIIGLQYYLPPSGDLWISGNYSLTKSDNIADFGANKGAVFEKSQWYDGNLFWQVTKAVRFGAEYAFLKQTFADASHRSSTRVQFSGFYLF